MPGNLEQVRVSLYADDTTLVVTQEDSIPLIFSICREFGLASGAKFDMDKTCGIWLGRWKDREDSPYGIKWVKSKKLLGVHFVYGEIFSDNWSPVMGKIIQALGMHSMRNLSMRGKAVICNVMATSKLRGIGLVWIKLKLIASLIMHVVRLLTHGEEYVPKWYISQYIGLDCIIGSFVLILHLTWSCTVWNILLGFIDSANYYLMNI